MEPRIDTEAIGFKDATKALLGVEDYLHRCGLDHKLMDLVKLRASQMNGCAYCIDMHWKDLRAMGETEQRLYGLDAWEESPYYTERERAALRWTEAVTHLHRDHVANEVYAMVREHFTEKELADLTVAIGMINLWNRLAISLRSVPGQYVSPHNSQAPAPALAEAMAASR